jgi:hypothetical protein
VGWGDLQAELGGLLPEELDLVLAISSLVVFRTFVDVLLAVLQHSIDQSCKPMSHGGDGFWGAEFATQASVLRTEVRLASQ